MIEIIYKDESGEAKEGSEMFHIPRNIRQIGLGGGKCRIYVEDYVYTFMNRLAEKTDGENGGLAILTGKAEWNEGVTYIFVKGAVYLDESVNAEHISLDNEAWKKIQDIGERYFDDLDVVGWFLTIPQMSMEITELIGKTHLKYFSGGEKVLMLMEPQEKDEAFFYYENGKFVKASGYYLYYEKNLKMQEYMTEYKWWKTSENEKVIPDEAVKSFRKRFAKKSETEDDRNEKPSVFSYAATACLVIAILATGTTFIKNYQQIRTSQKDMEASAVLTVNDQVQVSVMPDPDGRDDGNTEDVSAVKSESIIENEEDKERRNAAEDESREEGDGATENERAEESESAENVKENKTMAENENLEETGAVPENDSGDVGAKENVGKTESGSDETTDNAADGEDNAESEKDDIQINEEKADENQEMSDETSDVDEETEIKSKETSGKSILETYMIRPGDTLYQISILNYGNMDAIKEICRMNNITEEEKIYPGQIIVLP